MSETYHQAPIRVPDQFQALLPTLDRMQRDVSGGIEEKAEAAQTDADAAQAAATAAQAAADAAQADADAAQASADAAQVDADAAQATANNIIANLLPRLTRITVDTTAYSAAAFSAILVDDDTAAGVVTVTLPSPASSDGLFYHIKKLGSTANVVISGTIDGAGSATLTSQYEKLFVVCDGTAWWTL